MLIHIAHSLCINMARYSLRIVRGFYTGSMLVFLLLVTAPFGDLIAQ